MDATHTISRGRKPLDDYHSYKVASRTICSATHAPSTQYGDVAEDMSQPLSSDDKSARTTGSRKPLPRSIDVMNAFKPGPDTQLAQLDSPYKSPKAPLFSNIDQGTATTHGNDAADVATMIRWGSTRSPVPDLEQQLSLIHI